MTNKPHEEQSFRSRVYGGGARRHHQAQRFRMAFFKSCDLSRRYHERHRAASVGDGTRICTGEPHVTVNTLVCEFKTLKSHHLTPLHSHCASVRATSFQLAL